MSEPCYDFRPRTMSRRGLLRDSACGFGGLALAAMLGGASGAHAAAAARGGPFAPKVPHLRQRAKRVIFLFMWGGPSQMDTFDPKPRLNLDAGKPLQGESVGRGKKGTLGTVLGSAFTFARHGQAGIWMSELFPHLARQADKLCVIRSLHTHGTSHGQALLNLHTGQSNLTRPSVGAWVSYGLGCERDSLPAYVTISPPRGHGGVQNYGNAFLPPAHQGTAIGSAEIPVKRAKVSHLTNPRMSLDEQRRQLDLVRALGREHLDGGGPDPAIDGLIANYELAFKMQSTLPGVIDLDRETRETHELYGIGKKPTDNFGRQCLLARRLAEAGVRYIQASTNYTWDQHDKLVPELKREAGQVDQPIAALLVDLERRGLLEDTLVLWGGEFGRQPYAQNGDGRNHHPEAFTVWMAGGGVRPGLTYGATDEFGFFPVENPVHMHDLHATLLHALGLDHERLTYRHAGRDFRLTDVYGKVVHGVFA